MALKDTIWNFLWVQEWNIGFFHSSRFPEKLPEIKWLKSDYTEGWFADPFLLKENDSEIEVLVEEYNYASCKGRIDLLTVDKSDYKLKDIKVLLETDHHLSFPAIFRAQDKIYIYPENSEEGDLKIYEYNELSKTLENPVTILDDNVVDAIIRHDIDDDNYYIFATKYGTLSNNDELLIYQSRELTGKYTPVKKITLGNYGARGAGDWIENDGRIIRPSQDGSDLNQYGKGIILTEIKGSGENDMKEVGRIYPNSDAYPLGIHTINSLGSLYVVDGLKYIRPFTGRLTWSVRCFIRGLGK